MRNKKRIVPDDGSYSSARVGASVLYGISTLIVVLVGLALILFGVIVIINLDALSEILATLPESAVAFIMLDPILFIVAGVLVLLIGNLTNFAVYKIILTVVGIAADVKIIRDQNE